MPDFNARPAMRFAQSALRALALTLLAASPAAAVAVSADMSGGYGGQVMDVILQNWSRPQGAQGSVSVIVRITNEGRPFSCELRKSSGQNALDDSICLAVAKAAVFPPTPYGTPAEVALTFNLDAPAPAPGAGGAADQPRSYGDILLENATPFLTPPQGLTGEYSATIYLLIKPDGTLSEYKMEKPSGNAAVDAAILRALLQPGVIVAPPDGQEQKVYLTFNMKGQ